MIEVAGIMLASGISLFAITYAAIVFIGRNRSKKGISATQWHEYSEKPYNSYAENEHQRSQSTDGTCN